MRAVLLTVSKSSRSGEGKRSMPGRLVRRAFSLLERRANKHGYRISWVPPIILETDQAELRVDSGICHRSPDAKEEGMSFSYRSVQTMAYYRSLIQVCNRICLERRAARTSARRV